MKNWTKDDDRFLWSWLSWLWTFFFFFAPDQSSHLSSAQPEPGALQWTHWLQSCVGQKSSAQQGEKVTPPLAILQSTEATAPQQSWQVLKGSYMDITARRISHGYIHVKSLARSLVPSILPWTLQSFKMKICVEMHCQILQSTKTPIRLEFGQVCLQVCPK